MHPDPALTESELLQQPLGPSYPRQLLHADPHPERDPGRQARRRGLVPGRLPPNRPRPRWGVGGTIRAADEGSRRRAGRPREVIVARQAHVDFPENNGDGPGDLAIPGPVRRRGAPAEPSPEPPTGFGAGLW